MRYVPARNFQSHDAEILRRGVLERMGTVTIHMEPVAHIPREANGKFRAVRCLLDPAAARELRAGAVPGF